MASKLGHIYNFYFYLFIYLFIYLFFAVMKHHDQKLEEEKRCYLAYTSWICPPRKAKAGIQTRGKSWYTQKMLQHVIGHMLHYVHCILIYNSQKLERTQISYNRGMDTENVAHLHNEVLSAIKNNNFMKFLGKWMDLENILSEVTQS